jgi:hypothetical protein
LLDLDSPSWSLPAPLSYVPSVPPLTLPSRVSNLFHRAVYRTSMLRALTRVNANRLVQGHAPLASWGEYFNAPLILTNTVFGIELHRAVDAQGMHARRNANVHANGYTPRFRMTGPMLPIGNASVQPPPTPILASGSAASIAAATAAAAVAALSASFLPTLPSYPATLFDARLVRFVGRALRQHKRIVYVNLGEGDDLTRADVLAVLHGLKAHAKQLSLVWSLPQRNVAALLSESVSMHAFLHHTPTVAQFQFLAHYSTSIAFAVTHASMANVQECIAAGVPVLLMPHPYVEQIEAASRFVRTGAVYMLQRVQINEENVKKAAEKMNTDAR